MLSALRKVTNTHLKERVWSRCALESREQASVSPLPEDSVISSMLSGKQSGARSRQVYPLPRLLKYQPGAEAEAVEQAVRPASFLASWPTIHCRLSLISLTQLCMLSFKTHGSVEPLEAQCNHLTEMPLLLDKEFPERKIPSLPCVCTPGWVQAQCTHSSQYVYHTHLSVIFMVFFQ